MSKEYSCRIETVTKIACSLQFYKNGELCSSETLYDATLEEATVKANRYLAHYPPGYTYKLTPREWTEEVCIECGKESW